MNILFLTQVIPYPPDAGPKVKTWNVIRYLTGLGHRVILASFVRTEEEPFVQVMREVCTAVHTVPIRRSRLADAGFWLRSNLTGRPFLIERDDLAGMRELVKRLLAEDLIDVIHADQLTMTQFALPPSFRPINGPAKNGPTWMVENRPTLTVGTNGSRAVRSWPVMIFDAHNAVWTIVERMRQNAPVFLRPVAAIEARRIKRFEGMAVQSFDHTMAVTAQDRLALLEASGAYAKGIPIGRPRISVVPIAVDTTQLEPIFREPGSTNLLTLGTLHYPPNADGIRWFLKEVFPRIRREAPEVTLTIVGKNPPQDFLDAAAQDPEAIRVAGYVYDLVPYLEQAALMVVPVRAGGGMRVRILEAFSHAMPVVTTSVGLEGIDARPEEEVLVADTPEMFSHQVIRLLQNEALQTRLADNGRLLAVSRYDWQVVLKEVEEIYQDIKRENV